MVGPPPRTWTIDPALSGAREVADRVWCLRLPLPWELIPHVNAYAIERSDGEVMLIDCGGWGDETSWSTLLHALNDAEIPLCRVTSLLLTHYHSDHAGTAGRLIDETGCTLYGHASHHHFTDALLHPRQIASARARRALREGVPAGELPAYQTVREELEGIIAPVIPERTLQEGLQIEGWRVLEVPGHAPSQVCLYREEDRVLIGADLFGSAYTPYMDYGCSEDPVQEYLDSLAKVEALRSALLLPGHGRPLAEVSSHLRLWRLGIEREREAVLAAVRSSSRGDAGDDRARHTAAPNRGGAHTDPRSFGGYAVAKRVAKEAMADSRQAPTVLANVLSHLRHLRLQGLIERREEADGSYHYVAC
jgi:glyoxylase-like metal-dependent hydrolase (beta-lactamase superfamily II)